MIVRARAVFLSALIVTISHQATAANEDTMRCIASAEATQELIEQTRYREALERIQECLSEQCPAPIRVDCSEHLAEVRRLQPTVVFSVRNRRPDAPAVRVHEGQAVLAERLDGRPIALDPGQHLLTFESPGRAPLQRTIVVNAGEKARLFEVVWPSEPGAPEERRHAIGIGPFVVGGLSVALFATGAIVGAGAKRDVDALHASPCAATRTCDPEDVDRLRGRLLTADVLLGAGVLALGAALTWAILDHRAPDTTNTSSR
jgi:hypothetical protein